MVTPSDLRAKKAVAAIAQVRAKDNEFITSDFVAQLRKNGCPFPAVIPKLLEQQGLAHKSKGFIKFLSKEPVYYSVLVSGLEQASLDCAKYNSISKSKKKPAEKEIVLNKTTTENPAVLSSISTENLITELKKRGDYRIQQTVTQLIDC